MRRILTVGATMSALVVLAAAPAAAVTPRPIAVWQMNEPGGSTMVDSAGGDQDGKVGADVVMNGSVYRFPAVPRGTVRAQHLVTVPDSPALDPGTRDFAVTARFRTGAGDQNLLQKGQSSTAGGYFKLDFTRGVLTCLFRGAAGGVAVNSGAALNDQKFHTVRCERAGNTLTLTVDNRAPRRATGASGAIANTSALSIGGKVFCNGRTVGCDYFVGMLDFVHVDAGA